MGQTESEHFQALHKPTSKTISEHELQVFEATQRQKRLCKEKNGMSSNSIKSIVFGTEKITKELF